MNKLPIWRTEEAKPYMDRLIKVQNAYKNTYRDIMTFAGFCETLEELIAYVEGHEKR